ncbi:MAG: chorismate-binding protein [Cytophagaceae bacterium]
MITEVSSPADLPLESHSSQEIIRALFSTGFDLNKPVALWRLPDSSRFQLAVDLNGTHKSPVKLENSQTGFIVSPFLNKDKNEPVFIQASISYSSESHSMLYRSDLPEKEKQDFVAIVKENLSHPSEKNLPLQEKNNSGQAEKENFAAIVKKALVNISEGKFKKVVLAREKNISSQTPLDAVDLFFRLAANYSNAFVSLVSVPEFGVWIGATPELLLSVDKEKIFRTASLAGTQAYREGTKLSDCVWTQKEIEEQALVSRYIINCFKAIRLREYEDEGPRTVRAGSLLHLRTDFLADTMKLGFPELGSQMLELLHPTSAVCGMPKEEAMKFILEEEKFERSLFSGYLGPVNFNSETCLYVNLRCARLFHQSVTLFAGAGITQDSDPEKEWMETEMKMRTIGDYIQ